MASFAVTSFEPIHSTVTICGDPHGRHNCMYIYLSGDENIRISGLETEWMMTLAEQIRTAVLGYRIREEAAADDEHYVECDHVEAKTVIAEHYRVRSEGEHEDSDTVILTPETPTAESIAAAESMAAAMTGPTVEHDKKVEEMIRSGWALSTASPKHGVTWLYRVEDGLTRYAHVPHFYYGR